MQKPYNFSQFTANTPRTSIKETAPSPDNRFSFHTSLFAFSHF